MSFLKWLWNKWTPIAHAIGNFQAQVILSIFYIVIIFPLGIVYKIINPFGVKRKLKSNFGRWNYPRDTLESARKQY